MARLRLRRIGVPLGVGVAGALIFGVKETLVAAVLAALAFQALLWLVGWQQTRLLRWATAAQLRQERRSQRFPTLAWRGWRWVWLVWATLFAVPAFPQDPTAFTAVISLAGVLWVWRALVRPEGVRLRTIRQLRRLRKAPWTYRPPRREPCWLCRGSGKVGRYHRCVVCDGTGRSSEWTMS